ncbi:hypothetical protein jhhlp_004419 [Lomentospora prolificans]|uniref:Dihydroxyacetone kinase n=1 Tax=Lomentospora prolificans TaxID=41688 RepID=A0A2N3NBN1_9PEZI|nr:hypothetical protein jhhlp_004419 [Lomentospora prolificans]
MSAKHFINDPTHLVNSALRSLVYTNPSLALDPANKIVYRRPSYAPRQVSIVSGGGAGHEPSFAAMVGQGMLSAAVSGTIFASPSSEQIRVGLQSRVDTSRGVLVTVMNYTGDVLNFGVAVEKARAAGIDVEMVVVADDVGVGREKGGKVGRRGIAGTVLVHKISGALAAMGRPLAEVAKVARLTANNLASVGASLEHVHVPGRAVTDSGEDKLAIGEVELGMGIHNEPGSGRAKLELPELVKRMLAQLLDPNDSDRNFLHFNSNEIVLLVNNLGGVSVLELAGITTEVVEQLEQTWKIRPVRIISGTFMTSLNGLGFSITLLNVVNTEIGGPSMIELLDAPSEVTGWSSPIGKKTWEEKNTAERTDSVDANKSIKESGLKWDTEVATAALTKGLERLISAEPEITKYDTIVGDGDCGTGLKRGAEAVLKHITENPFSGDVVVDVAKIVPVVENTMDGTSGALFSIFLNALVHALRSQGPGRATANIWAAALQSSADALGKYTPARPGDRTLVDALHPFVEVLGKTGDSSKAAEGARLGAERTKGMLPGLGRSVYVGGDGYQKVPDPGAWGLACFFSGLAGTDPKEEGWEAV